MADLHWRTGFDAWKAVHLLLFAILFSLVAFGAVQAMTGFLLRRRGGDRFRNPPDDRRRRRFRFASAHGNHHADLQ